MAGKCVAGTTVAGKGAAAVERLPDSSAAVDEGAVANKGVDVGEGAAVEGWLPRNHQREELAQGEHSLAMTD
jgi:hypothetical protein